jgi:capsular exopolysaccharide synthesis family protein
MAALTPGPGAPRGGAPGEPHDEADKALEQLARLLGILRRRWLVVATTAAVGVAAALVTISTLQPRWRASATVVLHLSGPQVLDKVKGLSDEGEGRLLAYREYYQTQREIISSREVAGRALSSLGLEQDPVFLGVDRITSEPERLAKIAEIDPVERLREITFVEEVRGSRILKINADYPDAEIAAEIANALADAFLDYTQKRRTDTGKQAKENLTSERGKALAELRGAEEKIADFLEGHEISSVSLADRQNEITEAVIAETTHLKQAEADHYAAQAAYDEAKRLHRSGSLASATLLPPLERKVFEEMRAEQLAAEREVEQLSVKYGPKMPELQQAKRRLTLINGRIDREGEELLRSLKAKANATLKTKQRHEASLAAEKQRALEMAGLEREYRKLERDAKTADETYSLVAQRDAEIGMTNRVEAEGIEILDRATAPRKPVYPPKALLLALALVTGLGIGALLALAIDLRDTRIRSLVDLERAIASYGLPVLAQLPLLPNDARLGGGNIRAQRRQRDLHAFLYPQSLMAERCRGLRTALTFVEGSHPCRTLMITSPNSSEGKSSTTLNLAMSFCQSGKRVLLIDADMRRPRLHQVFTPPAGEDPPGLAALLQGTATVDEALLTGGDELGPDEARPDNLSVLLCGEVPQNPAELLDSAAMRKLLGELRERFDVILIDSPPVLPVTDPVILARIVDGVLLVARCQATSKADLQRAISSLRQGDTNLLGVVLNEVDPRSESSGYRVGYYAYGTREASSEGS